VGRADPEPSNKPEWSEVPETKRGADGACPLLSFVIDTGTDHASEILTSSEMPPQGTLFTSWSLPVERLESGLSAASVEYFVQVTSMRTVSSVKEDISMIKTQDTEMVQSSTLLDVTTPIS